LAEHFPLRLAASRMLAPAVRHMEFERADGAPFAFIPGQFVQIHFHYADGKPTKRSYSVATIGCVIAIADRRHRVAHRNRGVVRGRRRGDRAAR